jgi:4-amino-4-deoxy-L-arabinose transferase-like glycosyltransferase
MLQSITRWILHYRYGQPVDIDEAGYLTYALDDYRGGVSGGLLGWLSAIEAPSYQAPFATLVTSLFFMLAGPSAYFGFATTVFAGVIVIVSSFFLAREIGGLRVAAVSATLIACCPAIINGARSYSFALPVAAVTSVALLALIRSNRFTSAAWSSAFGVFLGLMPLTRTMSIAFMPALILSAVIAAATSPDRRRSLLLLCVALITAAAIMLLWFIPNGSYVLSICLSLAMATEAPTTVSGMHFCLWNSWYFCSNTSALICIFRFWSWSSPAFVAFCCFVQFRYQKMAFATAWKLSLGPNVFPSFY